MFVYFKSVLQFLGGIKTKLTSINDLISLRIRSILFLKTKISQYHSIILFFLSITSYSSLFFFLSLYTSLFLNISLILLYSSFFLFILLYSSFFLLYFFIPQYFSYTSLFFNISLIPLYSSIFLLYLFIPQYFSLYFFIPLSSFFFILWISKFLKLVNLTNNGCGNLEN